MISQYIKIRQLSKTSVCYISFCRYGNIHAYVRGNCCNFPCSTVCVGVCAVICVYCRSRQMEKPTRWGSGQIGCLSSLLLFNYTVLKLRGYLPTNLILQKEISTVLFIMQSADKSGTAKTQSLSMILTLRIDTLPTSSRVLLFRCPRGFWDRNR